MQSGSPRPLLARVRDTFFAPRRLFSAFGANPPWVDVLSVATIAAGLAVIAEPAEFFLAQMEDPVTRRGEPVEITSPQWQIVLYGRMLAGFSAVVGHPLIAFGIAGFLSLIFTLIGRNPIDFRQHMAVACHGLLILSAGMLVAVALRRLTGDLSALPTLGSVLRLDADGSWLERAAHGINFFTLWMLAVMGLGVETLGRGVTRVRATGLLWGGYGVLAVTLALLFHS